MSFKVPRISQAEIDSFHDAHFSAAAIAGFKTDFFPVFLKDHAHPPLHGVAHGQDDQFSTDDQQWAEDDYEEDDGLGYYPDGVKRTLTDEQIEIFRHSELEALRRAEHKAAKLRDESAELLKLARSANAGPEHDSCDEGELLADAGGLGNEATIQSGFFSGAQRSGSEDGELDDEDNNSQPMTEADAKRLKRKRARQRKQAKNKKFNPEPKIDLRKRTWDVVDAGMDSLDYDELDGAHAMAAGLAAKRRQISYDD